MPNYQYECDACRYSFEVFQSISKGKLQKCPQCGKRQLKRLIGTGSGIIFKGSGFYETDYKRKDPALSKPSDEKGSSGSSAAKSDTNTKTSDSPPLKKAKG